MWSPALLHRLPVCSLRLHATLLLGVAALTMDPFEVDAGANANATAVLTWSATSVVSNLVPTSDATRRLFVRLDGITSIQSAEVRVLWAPGGGEDPAYALSNWGAPSSATCSWLLRGSTLKLHEQSDSTVRLVATGAPNSACIAGNVFYLDFASPPNGDFPPGRFVIAEAIVVDENSLVDDLAPGSAATILGGTVPPAPRLITFAPRSGLVDVDLDHRIAAQNLAFPVAVSLFRPGELELTGQVDSVGPRLAKARFEFAAADTGFWHMKVTNAGGRFTTFPEPLLVSALPPAGMGVSLGSYDRLILTARPGALEPTGPTAVSPTQLRGTDERLRSALVDASVRSVRCLWPSFEPQPRAVVQEGGRVDSLIDLSRSFELTFDSGEQARAALRDLRAAPSVASVSPSPPIRGSQLCNETALTCGSFGSSNDASFGLQWYLQQTQARAEVLFGRAGEDTQTPCVWDLERPVARGTRSVILGILDTGIDATHPDLGYTYITPGFGQRILPGYNAIDGSGNIADGHGHGTMMAGLAAARSGNGTSYMDGFGIARGMAGVAGGWAPTHPDSSGVRILPVKLLDDDNHGSIANLVLGINWAALNGAKIINLSLTGAEGVPPEEVAPELRGALYNAMALGATCIAGTGNLNDSTTTQYPARLASWGLCTAVGGTDPCGLRVNLAPDKGSSFGSHVDVVAPSMYIYSAFPQAGGNMNQNALYYYEDYFGTSHATALTSGVAASLKSIHPGLADVDIEHVLRATAINPYGQPAYEVGAGRIAHREAVRRVDPALGQALIGGDLSTPSSIDSATVPLTIRSSDLEGVPDGTYTARRYILNFVTTFPIPFTSGGGVPVPIAWVRVVGTKGWNQGSPHYFNYGAGSVVALDNSGATFSTTVYRIPALGNRFVPNSLAEARVTWRALGKMSGTTDAPPPDLRSSSWLRVTGSPASDVSRVRLVFHGRPGEPVHFELYDVRGRRLGGFSVVPDDAGELRAGWPAAGDVEGRPPGLYFVRATQGSARHVGRIVLVR